MLKNKLLWRFLIMNKKLVSAIVLSTSLSMSLGFGTGSAKAYELPIENVVSVHSQETLSNEDVLSLNNFFNTYGVNEQIQNDLINKFNSGQSWDSFKQDSEPVSSHEVNTENGIENINTYQDGSITVSSVTPDIVDVDEFISPMAVDPGTIGSGTGYRTYKNAKIHFSNGIATASFYSNFTIIQGGNDFIERISDEKVTVLGGTMSNLTLKMVRKTETLDDKAEAKLEFIYNTFNSTAGGNFWMKLTVGGDSYKETNNFNDFVNKP